MSRHFQNVVTVLCLFLLAVAVGCNDQNKNLADQDQDAQSAADRIAELESQLDQSARDLAAAQDEVLALRTERDSLKDQLAKAGQGATADGWKSVPGGAMISISGKMLFDSGKATLKSSAKKLLDQIAGTIRQNYPNHDIYIFGHTDNEPIRVSGWKDNDELSCQRALSVLRYLRGLGVSQSLCACGWGEQRPVDQSDSAAGRQKNRRVEIFAMQQTGS